MSDDSPKIRDRLKRGLSDILQSSKPSQDKLSKKTKISGTVTPSGQSQTIIESSSVARSQGVISNESFQLISPSSFEQTLVMAAEHTAADTRVGKPEKQAHYSTATITVNSRSLWSKACDSNDLNEQRETLKGLGFQASALECVSEARGYVEDILNKRKRKTKTWKIDKLLNWIDKFKEIGDIVVQYDPAHAALPWAAFRFLLKICVDRHKTLDAIVDGLEHIASLIQRCTIYEIVYLREDSDASRNLEKSMLQLYIAVLKFLAKAIDKAKENHFKAVFTIENISDYLGNVKKQERTVKDDADVVGAQANCDGFEHLRGQLKDMNDMISHIQPHLHNVQNWLEDSDRSAILQWISAIPYISHHKRISEERLEGTGEWLFERPEYEEWMSSSESKLLLLRGIPGAGKTYIASKVIDCLQPDMTELKFAYFYCNRAEENRREPGSILNTIIQQLAQCDFDDEKLAKPVVDVYRDRKIKGQTSSLLSLAESQGLLVQLTEFEIFPRIELQPDDNVSDINQFIAKEVKRVIEDRELLDGKVSDELRSEICRVLCKRSKGM
ncbi:hypothetical protein BZA77DRAFT_172525 [Pyronema omphalodes]|nr:hypothetical protein BZA77DRAFT_172525 [Pyronema omphalodes]